MNIIKLFISISSISYPSVSKHLITKELLCIHLIILYFNLCLDTLADLACAKSPVKGEKHAHSQSTGRNDKGGKAVVMKGRSRNWVSCR